jgi:hypothetical protein
MTIDPTRASSSRPPAASAALPTAPAATSPAGSSTTGQAGLSHPPSSPPGLSARTPSVAAAGGSGLAPRAALPPRAPSGPSSPQSTWSVASDFSFTGLHELLHSPSVATSPPLAAPPADAQAAHRSLLLAAQPPLSVMARHQVGRMLDLGAQLNWVFDPDGRLLVNSHTEPLLRSSDGPEFAALPRSLVIADAAVLHDLISTGDPAQIADLRRACREAGMTRTGLEYLFDSNGRMPEQRLQALPQNQRRALVILSTHVNPATLPTGEEAPASPRATSRPGPPTDPVRARALLTTQQALASGVPMAEAARRGGIARTSATAIFDAQGRLVLRYKAAALLLVLDPAVALAFAEMPRTMRAIDVRRMCRVLHANANDPVLDLRQACIDAGVGMEAIEHVFEGPTICEDRLSALPLDQVRRLVDAMGGEGEVAPPSPLRGATRAAFPEATSPADGAPVVGDDGNDALDPSAVLKAGAMLAARTSNFQRVSQMQGIPLKTLKALFSSRGHLMLTAEGQSMVDGARGASFAELPRAMTRSHLLKLVERLRRHAQSPDLRRTCADAGVSQAALNFVFDDRGQLREDRIAELPEEQERPLRLAAAWPPAPQRPHRTHPLRSTNASGRSAALIPLRAIAPPIAAVLQFFYGHQRPAHALVEATAQFKMSRPALLALLASAGVTEMEARGGRLAHVGELWERLVGGLRGGPAPAQAPSHATLDDFAVSLENLLASPSVSRASSTALSSPSEQSPSRRRRSKRPAGAGTSSQGKRARGAATTGEPSATTPSARRQRSNVAAPRNTRWGASTEANPTPVATPDPWAALGDPATELAGWTLPDDFELPNAFDFSDLPDTPPEDPGSSR